MTMLSSLAARLLSDLSVSVGSRVYPMRLPDTSTTSPSAMPAVTYQLISEPLNTTHSGQVTKSARVQIDAWGASYKSAHAVASTIQGLHGYRGQMGDVIVGNIFRETIRDDVEPDANLYRVSQDFVIRYKE